MQLSVACILVVFPISTFSGEMMEWKPKEVQNSALDEYSNFIKWTEYIVPAPMIIALLSELAVLSNQHQDFSLATAKGRVYQFIKYPESFKTTLMQVCDESYYTFENAHNNMDKLRQQTARVPGIISDIVELLVTGEDEDIVDLLPTLLEGIKKIAKESKELSNETANKFNQTAKLIDEVTLASKKSEGNSKGDLHDAKLNAKIAEQKKKELEALKKLRKNALEVAKNRTEKAEKNYQKALDEIPSMWEALAGSVIDTAKDCAKDALKMYVQHETGQQDKQTEEQGNKDDQSSSEVTQIQQSSNMNLLEKASNIALTTIKEFKNDLFEKSKQLGLTVECDAFSNVDIVQKYLNSLEEEKSENENFDANVSSKLDRAMMSLRSILTNTQKSCQENTTIDADALSEEINQDAGLLQEAINSMNTFLRKSPTLPKSDRKNSKSDFGIKFLKAKQDQVVRSMEMLKVQEEQERDERNQFSQAVAEFSKVQGEIISLNAKIASLKEILILLKKALFVLAKLSAQWRKMATFFEMMDTMVETWKEGPQQQFVGIVEKGFEHAEKHKRISNIAKKLMFGYARESAGYAFLINRVSTGYFKISSNFLLRPMASLKELMVLDDKDERVLMKKKIEIKQQADAAIAKIEEFGKKEADRTIVSLQKKRKAIDEEFNHILSIQTPEEKKSIIKKTKEDMMKLKHPDSLVQANLKQLSKIGDNDFLDQL